MRRSLNKICWILLLGFWSCAGFSQSILEDIKLIRLANEKADHLVAHDHPKHRPDFLLQDHPSPFVRYNPLTLGFGSLMWFYQTTLTSQLSSTCIYSPTCSAYSKSLIRDFGLAAGIILTADRLTRCSRLALYDYPIREVDQEISRIRQNTNYYKLRR